MPSPGGRITSVTAYFGAFTGTGNGYACVWDGSGNLLGTGPINSVPAQSCSAGAQTFRTGVLSGYGVYVKGGTTLNLGFWMPSANGFSTSSEVGGGSSMKIAGSSPTDLSGGGSTGIGSLGVFGTYVPCLRKIRRGGVWVESPKRVRRSGVWVIGPRYIRRSGAWSQVQ